MQQTQLTPANKLEASYNRSKKFSNARIKNIYYLKQATAIFEDSSEDEQHMPQLAMYCKRLTTCACMSLYRTRNKGRQSTLITGLTCNHRLCNICNMLRSRKLRRKWKRFLQDDTRDIIIRNRQAHMFGLDTGRYDHKAAPQYTSGAEIMKRFDMMHLTLTMPHANGVWNDREYYAAELLKKFNELRKADWWLDVVYGGEYTVETTLGANGLHVHLHALVLTDKAVSGSRNFLFEKILLGWNALTVNYSDKQPAALTDADRITGIRSTLGKWADADVFAEVLPRLDARGATMVGLQSLYHEVTYSQAAKMSGTFKRGEKYYHYCKSGNTGSMLKGVIECLKYHFEPAVLEMPGERNVLNEPLLKAILPNIYRQRLYGKFGGFYGVKQLNVMEEPLTISDLAEDLNDTGNEIFDPATGGDIETSDFHYRIADARHVGYNEDKKHTLVSNSKTRLVIPGAQANTTRQAIQILTELGIPKKRG